ncbi:head-closure protein [Vibrio phage 1.182.O._10N.286.46.E1]|nr:head-closure protein [Vibrio phage 1.182.O._10N.286.46.E1]
MKSTNMKLNFNGGELSPLLDGRIDYPKYASGCKEMTNFVPTVYGPMTKRPGTRFVEDLGGDAQLYPFEFSEDQAYIFAFTDGSIEIFTNGGRLLDGNDDPVSLVNPYTLQQSKELKFAQTGDIVYFTHPEGGMYKISRVSAEEFTVAEFAPVGGPFQDINPDENGKLSFTPLTVSGETVLTVEVQGEFFFVPFLPEDVGLSIKAGYIPSTKHDAWIPAEGTWSVDDYLYYEDRIYKVTSGSGVAGKRAPLHTRGTESDGELDLLYISNGFGYMTITNVVSASTVSGDVIQQFPPELMEPTVGVTGEYTADWNYSSFGGRFGFPNSIVFHQQRMVLGGSPNQPQTIWGSVPGDIENFTEGVNDDQAYEFTISSSKKNPIAWLASNVFLNIGTLGSEFFISSSGSSITPTDVNIEQVGTYGSAKDAAPLIANGFTVFVQVGGRKLRELRFQEDTQRNFARDLNKVAEHIVDFGISQIAYQAEPYQVIWVIIGQELYALTYETDEDVFAWSRQSVGSVVSIATIPNAGVDRLWIVVERDGGYYIEYLTEFYRPGMNLEDAVFVDSSLEYEGPEVQTLTGLDHLEGKELFVLNNGSVGAPVTVEGGEVTLQYPTTKCVVGLPIASSWQSMRLEGGSNDGIGQGKSKRVNEVVFRLQDVGAGLTYGKGNLDLEFDTFSSSIPVRFTTDDMDSPPSLLNGDTWRLPVEGGTDTQYMFRVEHSEPVPCTIIALILGVDTSQ